MVNCCHLSRVGPCEWLVLLVLGMLLLNHGYGRHWMRVDPDNRAKRIYIRYTYVWYPYHA